jgi:hypothetical protein
VCFGPHSDFPESIDVPSQFSVVRFWEFDLIEKKAADSFGLLPFYFYFAKWTVEDRQYESCYESNDGC